VEKVKLNNGKLFKVEATSECSDESEDIEKEWSLFRSAIIASAVECCGQKRLVVGDSEKRTPRWNFRMLKKLFEQRKMHSKPCCRTGLHLIYNPGTLRREKLQL